MTGISNEILGVSFSIILILISCQFLGVLNAEKITVDNSPAFQNEILEEVNRFRELHSAEPLNLDDDLSKAASKWALLLHKKGKVDGVMKTWYAHPKNQGECVYTEGTTKNPEDMTDHIHKAVISWYCEITNFNFSLKRFREDSAQFTQMVWKETERAGFANAVNTETGDVAIVARFAPQGNWHYLEDFSKNVNEPSSYEGTKECPGQEMEEMETSTTIELGRSLDESANEPEPTTTQKPKQKKPKKNQQNKKKTKVA